MKIGNFTIRQQNGDILVDYRRSIKDWFDIFLYLIPGLAASAFIVIMYVHTHFGNWRFWIIAGLFAFFAFIKLAEGFTRLTQPTSSIIVINNTEHKLIAKYPYLRKTIVDLEDISKIQLSGVNERIRISKTTQIRTYSKIEVLDKYGKLSPILIINSTQLFRISKKKIETELYETGQKLAKFLAEKIKARYKWTGFHTTSE